jgi:hypothetical protein
LTLIDEQISTGISTLSVQKEEQIDRLVSTAVSTTLVPIQGEVKVLKEELSELKKLVNSGVLKPSKPQRYSRQNGTPFGGEGDKRAVTSPTPEQIDKRSSQHRRGGGGTAN